MKYFSPSYWFKLWLLSAPLFNDETIGINAKSIDNKKIKDWARNNTSLESIENQELTLSNNQTIQLQNHENIQSLKNLETDHFYENFLKTQGWSRNPQIAGQQLQEIQEEHHQFLESQTWDNKLNQNTTTEVSTTTHKIRHQKHKNRKKRGIGTTSWTEKKAFSYNYYIHVLLSPEDWEWIAVKFQYNNKNDFLRLFIDNFNYLKTSFGFSNVDAKEIGEIIYDNFRKFEDIFISSSKKNRIKFIIKNPTIGKKSLYDARIYNSEIYPNKYLKPNLTSDFKYCPNAVDDNNDQTILAAIKDKNPNLDTSQVYVKEKTINGKLDIGVKSDSNKYNINVSASCNNFQVKSDLDKFIKSLDPRISFLGSDMQERGVLWLDTLAKRIKFYPRTDDDSNEKTFGTIKNIIIKDQNDNTIRVITFNLDNTMSEVLNAHNLNSKKVLNDGLGYENGYSIEITSYQADTTWFKRNDDHNWNFNTSKAQHTEKFFIINNWLWHKDYYLKKQRNEINLKINLNLPTTFFQNNFYCKENNILTNINKETILDKSKIILSSAIDNKNNVYISTDNGVYKINFEKNENWKIPGFNNDLISKIILDESNNPYFISVNGNAYFLTNHWFWWNSAQRIDKYHNVPEIKNVLAIKTIKSPDLTNKNGVYFATDHGVFYMKSFSWTANKIGGINEKIVKISIDTSGNVYFISVNGNAYYITNTFTWTAERIDIKHNVPEIKNVLAINEIPNSDNIFTNSDNVYFATNHGVFYMNSFSWTANKIGGINEIIAEITIDKNGNAYFISVNGNAYFLKNGWFTWTAVKIDDYYNVPEIKNVLSIKTDDKNIYYSTENGLYIMIIDNWTQIKKINEIDKIITEITTSNNNLDCFKSFSSFENKKNNKYEIKQNENPEIIVDDENQQTIQGIELLHNLQRGGDYGLIPVNRINRGYLNFVNSFDNVLRYFINQGIVTNHNDHETFRFQRGIPYRLTNSNGFFIVNVNIINLIQNRRLQLVFRSNNLYLQGFTVRNGDDYTSAGTYYYFRGDDIINDLRDPTLNSERLRFNAHYSGSGSMQSRENDPPLNWNLITQSFRELLNYNNSRTQLITIQNALTRVIFATSESWRFNYLYTEMALVSTDRTASFPWSNFDPNLTDWGTRSNFQGPLDIETIFDRNENFIDLRHLEHSFLSTLRIANSPSWSRQSQNGDLSKSGYTLEELTNKKYNLDFQQAQINYQRNQNLNDYRNAQQRFQQAQIDYILHILPDGRSKIDVFFNKNIIGFDNSTINTTIPSFDISTINSLDYQNQSLANVSSTNIPTI